jgi:multidrug efflux system membrane fusion protein
VRFTLAERHLPAILRLTQAGPLEVGVLPEGDTGPMIMGAVTAVNNEVDRTTGSIRLHAVFPNDDNRLWPGQFVRVTLVMAMLEDAVLVPEKAVQEGMSGPYVYLAAPDPSGKKDMYRVTPVSVKSEPGPKGFVVISEGLSAGDVIVTEGQLGLAPGGLAMDMGERR